MSNIKSVLEVQARELSRELKKVSGIKTKTKFTPWRTETRGFGTKVASWTKSISILLLLDRAAGLDRYRFWVGFLASSQAALDELLARLPRKDQPTITLKVCDYVKLKSGDWRYRKPKQKELTRPYADHAPTDEFFYGFYDWGGHAAEKSLQLAIYPAFMFIKNTVESVGGDKLPQPSPPDTPDPVRRIAVEKAAMKGTREHFEGRGFVITDRSMDNCGWDLDAKKPGSELRLEVKGLSGNGATVEVTPNEYEASDDPNYRICIVTNALSEKRKLRVFKLRNGKWVCAGGDTLKVEQRMSARLTVITKGK